MLCVIERRPLGLDLENCPRLPLAVGIRPHRRHPDLNDMTSLFRPARITCFNTVW